jgi:hypothetical protein
MFEQERDVVWGFEVCYVLGVWFGFDLIVLVRFGFEFMSFPRRRESISSIITNK